jgi:transcriptional repressor NrdR
MKCPKCGSDELKVNEKRDLPVDAAIRRRRECNSCGNRFTTYERIESPSINVIKKDGTLELYSRDKLAAGFYKALKKRSITPDKIEELIDSSDHEIRERAESDIKSTAIGEIVMEKLKEADPVAYLRYASVYKAFQDVESFTKEVESLRVNDKPQITNDK